MITSFVYNLIFGSMGEKTRNVAFQLVFHHVAKQVMIFVTRFNKTMMTTVNKNSTND